MISLFLLLTALQVQSQEVPLWDKYEKFFHYSYSGNAFTGVQLSAVICGNDGMAMGAYQALVAAGKEKQVKVFGFDGAEDVITSIGENKVAATGMRWPEIL